MTTNRIHACLDGDLPFEELTDEERRRAEELDALLEAAAAPLRAAPAPDLAARVMASLPEAAPRRRERSGLAAALAWLWSPTPIRLAFRPAYGLAFAALAAVLVTQLPSGDDEAVPQTPARGAPVAVAPPAGRPPVYVQFRLEARGASTVQLAGTFTGWQPSVRMVETAPGEWTALVPLAPGVHDYAFVIDGERWVADPHAPQVDDDFGGTNSRISLPPMGSS